MVRGKLGGQEEVFLSRCAEPMVGKKLGMYHGAEMGSDKTRRRCDAANTNFKIFKTCLGHERGEREREREREKEGGV